MSEQQTQSTSIVKAEEKSVRYVPFGGKEAIELSINVVKTYLTQPTKSGKLPENKDVVKFMMLCKARELNPWEGDAFLVGYDSEKHGPQFSLITAHQAFLKRAEACVEYNGMQSGIVVRRGDEEKEIEGELIPLGHSLVGGWARVHRKDRAIPMYKKLDLQKYKKTYGLWLANEIGMIVKCAEADALRSSFPNKLANLYIEGEREPLAYVEDGSKNGNGHTSGGTKAAALKAELQQRTAKPATKPEVVTEGNDTVIVTTGEVVEFEQEVNAEAEEPEKIAQQALQTASEEEKAPYPKEWPERRKVEKPKGFAMTWSAKECTPKFLDKLRKEGSQEAAYEIAYRDANEIK